MSTSRINNPNTYVGDLNNLTTSDKSSIVGAVNALNSNIQLIDASSNISSTVATFQIKQYHIIGKLAILAFEMTFTSNVSAGGFIIKGIYVPKGTWINFCVSITGGNPWILFTQDTEIRTVHEIQSGKTLAGTLTYVIDDLTH